MTDGLFDLPPRAHLEPGEAVVVACSWGDEPGHVQSHVTKDGHALVRVRLNVGTSVEVTPGRVSRAAATAEP